MNAYTNNKSTLFNKAIFWLLFFYLLLLSSPAFSSKETPNNELSDPYKKQRILFLKAERYLDQKNNKAYQTYYKQLDGYPLQSYLKYRQYRKQLSSLSEKQVLTFVNEYKDTPYANWLRTAWLDKMAKQQKWQQYLNAYTPQNSTRRQCHYANALLKIGDKERAFKYVPKLWLVGQSQPKSCDTIFSAFKKAGKLTPELIWERIKLAMAKGRISLAKYLAKSLPKNDQLWLKEWAKIYHKPKQVLSSSLLKKAHPIKSSIQVHAVKRMTRTSPQAAIDLLSELEKNTVFTLAEQDSMYRAIGMKLAYRHGEGAWFWLDKISDKNSDETVRQWRARSAIREGNWTAINRALKRLSKKEQKDFRWQYWAANSKQHLGKKTLALQDYYQLAQNRSYYGFLAADKMDMPYAFQNAPLTPDERSLNAVKNNSGILRAKEFYFLGRTTEMRREWYFTTRKQMDNNERAIAAKVAQQWGWHHRAIITMAYTDQRNDIELRFPVIEKERIIKYSERHKVQPAYTMAVIRRESAFAIDARSRVGALGLMQIMPATGKLIARKLKTKLKNKNQLLNPETNVKFGTKYLNMMLNKFHNQPALASAAYNAGGHRVRAWLPKGNDMEADRWVESIPFKETREYVSSILAYTAIYEHRLGLPQSRLETIMPDVPKKDN